MPISQEARRVNNIDGMRPPSTHAFFPETITNPKQRVNMDIPLVLSDIGSRHGLNENRNFSTYCQQTVGDGLYSFAYISLLRGLKD